MRNFVDELDICMYIIVSQVSHHTKQKTSSLTPLHFVLTFSTLYYLHNLMQTAFLFIKLQRSILKIIRFQVDFFNSSFTFE